ncbi:MAG: DUF2796 domain-containing protein [Pseudoruegeria sp.]
MKHFLLLTALTVVGMPALAEETRQLDAHEHGVGALDIAIDGETVLMAFHAPGADIVGFEYQPESPKDRSTVAQAIATLANPLNLFVVPEAAACTVVQATAELEGKEDMHEHDEDEHHAEHDDHHEDEHHAEHDDHHEDEHHAEHDDHHEDEHHAEHEGEEGHSEFHAEYTLNCSNPNGLNEINFAYFETFENAREIDVQVITEAGAQAFEVERAAPLLDLRSLF